MLHCGDLLNFIQNQSHEVALREYGTPKKKCWFLTLKTKEMKTNDWRPAATFVAICQKPRDARVTQTGGGRREGGALPWPGSLWQFQSLTSGA